MARTAVVDRSEGQSPGQVSFDKLRFWLFAVHIAVVVYAALGWLITSRPALYFYTLLLPLMALQWLLNGGCSIVNNLENLVRVGHWHDPDNRFEGAFFSTLLRAAGIRATQAQITTALCSLMLIFWVSAICRMMLIVSGQ